MSELEPARQSSWWWLCGVVPLSLVMGAGTLVFGWLMLAFSTDGCRGLPRFAELALVFGWPILVGVCWLLPTGVFCVTRSLSRAFAAGGAAMGVCTLGFFGGVAVIVASCRS